MKICYHRINNKTTVSTSHKEQVGCVPLFAKPDIPVLTSFDKSHPLSVDSIQNTTHPAEDLSKWKLSHHHKQQTTIRRSLITYKVTLTGQSHFMLILFEQTQAKIRQMNPTVQCTVGGFNVSKLMGIKRRMIYIGKKITFYFLQNV
jgi:hypothetical protein